VGHYDGMRALATSVLLALVGCRGPVQPELSLDPAANFAAHVEHDRIVIDRLPGGRSGVVAPPGWFRWGGAPTFVLDEDGRAVADLWLTAPASVKVRTAGAGNAPVEGSVEPAWDDNAIRLTLHQPGMEALRTDSFARAATGAGPPVLSRIAQTVLDVRGTYRATLHDASGAETGWLRVRISPYQASSRIYDGVVPPEVAPGLVAAIPVALGSEIDWIEDHTLDVYRGTMTGPLHESIPVGR